MKQLTLACLFLSFSLLGCGGSGGSSTPSTPSTYAGEYSGTWSSSSGDQGTTSLTVANGGAVTASLDDTTANATGTMSGSITNAGALHGTVTYPGQTSTVSGTFTTTNTGISGTLIQTYQGHNYSVQFTLTKN